MTSTLQKWVLILDIPRTIYELQKLGYKHFQADFEEDTRRVHLRAWKDVKPKNALKCEGTPTEECDHPPFNNRRALDWHQIARKHGKYAEVKAP
ncbi:MAG: hypothetical protein JRN23_04320 [Nitrososphaerota archaeon]|nr:hypothetical protein [Nitrososphaerota archaeon]